MIKIKKQKKKVPLKIVFSKNKCKHIEVNGLLVADAPKDNDYHEFSMFLPGPGEFRILPDTCSNAEISSAVFYNNKKSKEINFSHRFNQGYEFIDINETGEKTRRVLKMLELPIRRGIVDHSGVLKFNITRKAENFDYEDKGDTQDQYYIISEFRPSNKELIMKDYVELWGDKGNTDYNTWNYTYQNQMLKLEANIPTFKNQLKKDYPNIKKIKITFYFYLMARPEFVEKMKRCGMGELRKVKKISHKIIRVISKNEINTHVKPVNFYFGKADLQKFKKFEKVNVFCRMDVRFIEDEEDDYDIALNQKFATIPYFFLTINNPAYSSFGTSFLIICLCVTIILGLLYVYASRNKGIKLPSSDEDRKEYQKGNSQEITKIEMADIN